MRCGVAAGLLAREQGEEEEGGGGGGFRADTMREEVISFWAGPSLSGAVGRGLWAALRTMDAGKDARALASARART